MKASRLLLLCAALAGLGCQVRAEQQPPDAPGLSDAGAATPGEALRVATFNLHRFFDSQCQTGQCGPQDYEEQPTPAQFEARADQLALAIRQLGAGLVLLQEVETQACLDALQQRLADVLPSAVLGEIGAPGSVDVAVLAASSIQKVVRHRDQVLTRPDGTRTLFSREFLEVHLAFGQRQVVAFAAHFRSKVSDDPGRRLAEASAAHDLLLEVADAEPEALVLLAGDLNDVPGSPPIDALESDGKLLRVASELPAAEQGTYQYFAERQAIDHIFEVRPKTGGYLPGTTRILWTGRGYGGSDHAALLAEFR